MNYVRSACAVGLLLMPTSLHAEWAALTSAKDNTLYESQSGSLSNGAGSYMFTGTTADGFIRRGLIAFDVASAIPAGSVIESVQLTLHMSRTPAASEPVSLHRLTAEWGEGTSVGFGEEGGGAPSTLGDATWQHRFYPNVAWDQPGGDFDDQASAGIFVIGNGFYTWGTTPTMVADAQAWLDQPGSNFGWLLLGNEELLLTAKRFDSRENPEPAFRPSLEIEYTPIPEPEGISLWLLSLLACKLRSRTG